MSHDKVIRYIDTELKDLIPDDKREELIALHYQSIHDARTSGIKEGLREKQTYGADTPNYQGKPTPPENETVQETGNRGFAVSLMLLVAVLTVVVVASL